MCGVAELIDSKDLRSTEYTPHLAFFVHLKVTKGIGGEKLLPILWEDNFFPLLPGESREIRATYRREDLGGVNAFAVADGWNLAPP
jgi:exo-1,4-beta-D-glucosaminidase